MISFVEMESIIYGDIELLLNEIRYKKREREMQWVLGVGVLLLIGGGIVGLVGFISPFIVGISVLTVVRFWIAKEKFREIGILGEGESSTGDACKRMAERHFAQEFFHQELGGEYLGEEKKLREGNITIFFDPKNRVFWNGKAELVKRNITNLIEMMKGKAKYIEGINGIINSRYGDEVWGDDIYRAYMNEKEFRWNVKNTKDEEEKRFWEENNSPVEKD